MRNFLVRGLITAAAMLGVFIMAGATAQASVSGPEHDPVFNSAEPGTIVIQATKLTHAQATSRLRAASITWSSSGDCSNRNNPTCTSFEQVNLMSIQGAETLKRASGCTLNVTGGTETGHASGTYSHWNGYKLDYGLNSCLTSYIRNNFTSIGGNQWRSGSGNIYFLESNHWDVTYYNCGGC
jgi:hypothetical protein